MKKNTMINLSAEDRDSLYKRYFFWLYKTIRDEVDRVDRKFTQIAVDEDIAASLERALGRLKGDVRRDVSVFVDEWKNYVAQKIDDARKLKFASDGALNARYVFLRLKLKAVEELIVKRAGRQGLKDFKKMYEDACLQDILQDHSGRR